MHQKSYSFCYLKNEGESERRVPQELFGTPHSFHHDVDVQESVVEGKKLVWLHTKARLGIGKFERVCGDSRQL